MSTDAASSRLTFGASDRPYAPGWINRLTWWIDRVPGPSWLVFAAMLALTGGITFGQGMLGGFGARTSLGTGLYYAALPVAMLWLIYYLDGEAHRAMDTFEPALDAPSDEVARLRYSLTVVPAAPALVLVVLSALLLAAQYLLDPAGVGIVGLTTLGLVLRIIGEGIITVLILVLLYHTLRQLRAVDRIHALAARIDLFRPAPLYAFSLLTSRTAIGLILIGGTSIVADPVAFEQVSPVLMFTWLGSVTTVAVAAFVLPLRGMHRRIAAEKGRLQGEAGDRLKTTIGALHRSVDSGDLADADALNKTLASLVTEREVLDRLPTWPWRPGTLGAFATAIGLPIVLFLITRFLDRLV
ncbi:MAG: hypothetical protein M3P32_05755 [Chloroflexota bacterium]|nr:hypothetical protein [Chloroflexota bacterium]